MDAITNKTDPKNKSIESDKKDKELVKVEEPKKESTGQVKECTCIILSGNINYII